MLELTKENTMSVSQVPLSPLYISKLNEIPYWEKSQGEDTCLEKINFVIQRSYLISNKEHSAFNKYNEIEKGGFSIHSYRAIGKNLDPIFDALGEREDEEETNQRERGQHEFLIFLFQKSVPNANNEEQRPVMVLSTEKAYKVISQFCSQDFPMNISVSLLENIKKIEQVLTGQLWGPISNSKLHLRSPLPPDVEQRGLINREFTAVLEPFITFIEGSEIRVKFWEKGILIYRDFFFEEYLKITEELLSRDLALKTEGSTLEWKMPDLPKEFTSLPHGAAGILDQILASYIVENEMNIKHFKIEFELSERWFSNADEYRMHLTEYASETKGGKHSFLACFPNPYKKPHMDDIRKTLQAYPLGRYHLNKNYIQTVLERREISMEYKVKGFWHSIPLLDCLEGRLEDSQNQAFFKMENRWYQVAQKLPARS